ncbi:hypothetical protein D3C86_2203560 [compost metagenome]
MEDQVRRRGPKHAEYYGCVENLRERESVGDRLDGDVGVEGERKRGERRFGTAGFRRREVNVGV